MIEKRPAVRDDFDWLWNTYKSELITSIQTQWGWEEDTQLAGFIKNFDIEKYKIITLNQQKVAAYYLLDNTEDLYLKMLLVIKSQQRRGIGTEIVNQIKALARLSNKPITLNVIEANPAIDFYKKHGFYITNTKKGCHFLRWQP